MDAFLAEINLAQHATILDKLGYDDPNDFAEFEASDLKKLETRCADEGTRMGQRASCTHGWTGAMPCEGAQQVGRLGGGKSDAGASVGRSGNCRHVCTVAPVPACVHDKRSRCA